MDIEFEGTTPGEPITLPAGRIKMADGSNAALPDMPQCTSLLGKMVEDRLERLQTGTCLTVIMSAFDAPQAEVEYTDFDDNMSVRYYTVYADRLHAFVRQDNKLEYADVF